MNCKGSILNFVPHRVVRETRVTAFFSHVMIGLSIFIMFAMAYIPTPVLFLHVVMSEL